MKLFQFSLLLLIILCLTTQFSYANEERDDGGVSRRRIEIEEDDDEVRLRSRVEDGEREDELDFRVRVRGSSEDYGAEVRFEYSRDENDAEVELETRVRFYRLIEFNETDTYEHGVSPIISTYRFGEWGWGSPAVRLTEYEDRAVTELLDYNNDSIITTTLYGFSDASSQITEGYAISLNMIARPCRSKEKGSEGGFVISHQASPYVASDYK